MIAVESIGWVLGAETSGFIPAKAVKSSLKDAIKVSVDPFWTERSNAGKETP